MMNWKEGRRQLMPTLRNYYRIYLEEMRKTTKILRTGIKAKK
jgi:hypothetical protein